MLCVTLALAGVAGCAKGKEAAVSDAGGGDAVADASCGDMCDQDGDGVFDPVDKCPGTPAGAKVNHVGCSDGQLNWMMAPAFPPFGLAWSHGGDPGRAGGLNWTYANIDRADLFHIVWVACDDPATPCGMSLDGPIDAAAEDFAYSAAASDLPNGKLVLTNTTHIALANGTMPQLNGRMTITFVDMTPMPIPVVPVAAFGLVPRTAMFAAEIKGTGFTVTVLAEVQDPTSMAWSPYLDYYDAAPTPATGGTTGFSLDGAFYDK